MSYYQDNLKPSRGSEYYRVQNGIRRYMRKAKFYTFWKEVHERADLLYNSLKWE